MDETPTVKFNAAIASTERLHHLLEDCNDFSRQVDIGSLSSRVEHMKLWENTIDAVYKEIYPKITNNSKDIDELFNKIGTINISKSIYNNPSETKFIIIEEEFNKKKTLLRSLELKLRFLADKVGLLIPNKKSMNFLLGED